MWNRQHTLISCHISVPPYHDEVLVTYNKSALNKVAVIALRLHWVDQPRTNNGVSLAMPDSMAV